MYIKKEFPNFLRAEFSFANEVDQKDVETVNKRIDSNSKEINIINYLEKVEKVKYNQDDSTYKSAVCKDDEKTVIIEKFPLGRFGFNLTIVPTESSTSLEGIMNLEKMDKFIRTGAGI